MDEHDKILEEAIVNYREMPFETQELYKKYNVNLQIPLESKQGEVSKEIDSLKKQILDESRIRFDLTNEGDDFSVKSEFVKIVKGGDKTNLEEAKNETAYEQLGVFITKTSKNTILVDIPDKKEVKLNFLLIGDDRNMPINLIVQVGHGSKLDLFEWYASVSEKSSINAPFHVIKIGKKSNVEVNILHNENSNTEVGCLNRASVGEDSVLRLNMIYNGGKLTKSATYADAAGERSNLLVNEIIFGHSEQKFDIGSFLLNSNRFTKAVLKSGAVLKGKSFCVLKGYAKVSRNTKGSYSNVEEKGLVIDPDARMQPLPDMSIDCNEVAFASHSAATAPLDKEALFYLMSRGIEEQKAKRIFVASFISKYLSEIENDIVKEIAISIMLDKLDNDRHSSVPKISMQNLWIVPKQERMRK